MERPGIRLKNLREARGLTIDQLIQEANIIRPTPKEVAFIIIRGWENGLGKLTDSMLIKFAKYFGVTTDYLLGL